MSEEARPRASRNDLEEEEITRRTLTIWPVVVTSRPLPLRLLLLLSKDGPFCSARDLGLQRWRWGCSWTTQCNAQVRIGATTVMAVMIGMGRVRTWARVLPYRIAFTSPLSNLGHAMALCRPMCQVDESTWLLSELHWWQRWEIAFMMLPCCPCENFSVSFHRPRSRAAGIVTTQRLVNLFFSLVPFFLAV